MTMSLKLYSLIHIVHNARRILSYRRPNEMQISLICIRRKRTVATTEENEFYDVDKSS